MKILKVFVLESEWREEERDWSETEEGDCHHGIKSRAFTYDDGKLGVV